MEPIKQKRRPRWSSTYCQQHYIRDEADINKEHIIVSCELAGFSEEKTNRILNKYYDILKDYVNIRPIKLSYMLPNLILEWKYKYPSKCL